MAERCPDHQGRLKPWKCDECADIADGFPDGCPEHGWSRGRRCDTCELLRDVVSRDDIEPDDEPEPEPERRRSSGRARSRREVSRRAREVRSTSSRERRVSGRDRRVSGRGRRSSRSSDRLRPSRARRAAPQDADGVTLALAIFSFFLCFPLLAGIALLMAHGKRGPMASMSRGLAFTCLALFAILMMVYFLVFLSVAAEAGAP